MCPSIDKVTMWWSENVFGGTAMGDVRMSPSFREIQHTACGWTGAWDQSRAGRVLSM